MNNEKTRGGGCGIGDIALLATVSLILFRASGVLNCPLICTFIPIISYGILITAAFTASLVISAIRLIWKGRG